MITKHILLPGLKCVLLNMIQRTCFQDSQTNRKFKRTAFIWNILFLLCILYCISCAVFCKVFTVTSDQFTVYFAFEMIHLSLSQKNNNCKPTIKLAFCLLKAYNSFLWWTDQNISYLQRFHLLSNIMTNCNAENTSSFPKKIKKTTQHVFKALV